MCKNEKIDIIEPKILTNGFNADIIKIRKLENKRRMSHG